MINLLNSRFATESCIRAIKDSPHTDLASSEEEAITLLNKYFSGALPIPETLVIHIRKSALEAIAFSEAFTRLNNRPSQLVVIIDSNQEETLTMKYLSQKDWRKLMRLVQMN